MSTRQYVALETYEKVTAELRDKLTCAHYDLLDAAETMKRLADEVEQLLEWQDIEGHAELKRQMTQAVIFWRSVQKDHLDREQVAAVEEELPPPQVALAVDEVTGSW